MAGINTSGSASGDNVLLGRGRLYFAPLDANNVPGAYRLLGNATDFQISTGSETLDRKNFQSGLAVIDKKIVIEQSVSLNFTLDELTFDNLALFFSGTASDGQYTSTNSTSIVNKTLDASPTLGQWYELTDANGDRLYNITSVSGVNPPAAANRIALADNGVVIDVADIEFNNKLGLVRVLQSHGAFAGTLTFSFTSGGTPNTVLDQMVGLTSSSVSGALKFISENPANADERVEYQFHKVTLLADGEMALIGDELATVPITGQVEENVATDADSGYLTIRTFAQ